MPSYEIIQGDSRGKDNILGGDNIGRCEKKCSSNMYLIMNDYRTRALKIYRYKSILNGKREIEIIANCILILI